MFANQECNLAETKFFLKLLESLALSQNGKIVLASFGENPATGEKLNPLVKHFLPKPDVAKEMLSYLSSHLNEPHRNFYFGGYTLKSSVSSHKKGGESDIERVLMIVTDFDLKNDSRAGSWRSRLPQSPDPQLVVETSPGSFQVFYLFDKPCAFEEAKPVVRALANYCGCDPVSKDLAHVWRIPGLPNWPNKEKVQAGRSPKPFIARIAHQWKA